MRRCGLFDASVMVYTCIDNHLPTLPSISTVDINVPLIHQLFMSRFSHG